MSKILHKPIYVSKIHEMHGVLGMHNTVAVSVSRHFCYKRMRLLHKHMRQNTRGQWR